MAIFSFTNIFVSLFSLYVARRLHWEATTGSRRRAISKKNGCLPVPTRRNRIFPSFIPTFGLDFLLCNWRAYRTQSMLDLWMTELRSYDVSMLSINVFGQQIFLTDDPENTKTMLATRFDEWSIGKDRIDLMSSYLGHGIFTTEGRAWKHSRDMLRPCFEKTAVADVSKLEQHCERLFKLLPTNGEEVDLQPFFHELTLDVATEFLFGQSTNSLTRGDTTEQVQDFVKAFDYCGNPLASEYFQKYGYLGLLIPDGQRKRNIKFIQDFVDKIIDEEMALKADREAMDKEEIIRRYILLDELITATSDRTVIRSELLNILLAGRDTTASLLSNIFWELSRQPEILLRLHGEIVSTAGDDLPSYERLKDMKYLRAIINESQRLYPIVPSNSREALQDNILPHGTDGAPVLIPKGSYVVFHPWTTHRRNSIFGDDSSIFNPDRWLRPDFRPGWAFVPFSGGPRVCLGQNFALTEVMFVIVRFSQQFHIEQKDFSDWREKLTMTCTGAGGCKIGLRKRNN